MRVRNVVTGRITLAAVLAGLALAGAVARERSAGVMAERAQAFLGSLSEADRARATFALDHVQRFDWAYVPRARQGMPLKDLSADQRRLAHELLKTGLSASGYRKATAIIELENVLRAIESGSIVRDPELYFFTIFGTPSTTEPWGWRVEGHHLSLNFTVVKGTLVANTPAFFGANPAEVRVPGPQKGQRVLAAEEDKARALVRALTDAQRRVAIIEATAPRDILTTNSAKADPLAPAGVELAAMPQAQQAMLRELIDVYLAVMPDDIAAARRQAIARTGEGPIRFAWMGGFEPGQPHYYRVQGPTFLIEYDNTQNDANHIHSVWRDFEGDFGRDLLREHYRSSAH
jgi:hypothetical protein